MRSVPRYSDEVASEMRKKYEAGATTESLAKDYHTYASTVCRLIRRAGGTVRTDAKKTHKFPDNVAKEMRRKYEAGATLQDLVNEYGTHRTTISNNIQRVGGMMRRTGYEAGTRRFAYRKPKKGLLSWLNA